MSVKIMGAVWDSALPHNLKFVLLSYADHANHEGGDIWPAVATTARKTGFTERAVQKITRQLTDAAILIDDGVYSNNVRRWRIDLDALALYGRGEQNSPPPEQISPPAAPRGELDDNQGVNSTTSRGEPRSPKPTTDPSLTDPSIGGGGGDPDPISQDHPDSEKNTRAPARATPPDPTHPSDPPQTYAAANTHRPALLAALAHAEILDPDTRASILASAPALTVEAILAWDAYRARTNGRRMGPGALVSLLRTAANPPRSTTDPDHTARWLTTHGYLPAPEPSDWSDHPDPPIPPPPSPANDLWRRLIDNLSTSSPNLAHRLAHYPVTATLTGDTLHIATHPELVHHLTRPHSVLPGVLNGTLTYLAGRPLTLTIAEAAP